MTSVTVSDPNRNRVRGIWAIHLRCFGGRLRTGYRWLLFRRTGVLNRWSLSVVLQSVMVASSTTNKKTSAVVLQRMYEPLLGALYPSPLWHLQTPLSSSEKYSWLFSSVQSTGIVVSSKISTNSCDLLVGGSNCTTTDLQISAFRRLLVVLDLQRHNGC